MKSFASIAFIPSVFGPSALSLDDFCMSLSTLNIEEVDLRLK